jgi:hypothetical protein
VFRIRRDASDVPRGYTRKTYSTTVAFKFEILQF